MRRNKLGFLRHISATRCALVLIALVTLIGALSCTDDDGGTPQASSVSHWVKCESRSDCDGHPSADACVDGFCVDADGERIESAAAADDDDQSDDAQGDDAQGDDDQGGDAAGGSTSAGSDAAPDDGSTNNGGASAASDDDASGGGDDSTDGSSDDQAGADDAAATDDSSTGDSSASDDASDDVASDDSASDDSASDDTATDGGGTPVDASTTEPEPMAADDATGDDATSLDDSGGVIAAPPGDPCEVETHQGCSVDSDCTLATLVDCCGTDYIVGFAESDADGLELLTTQCEDWNNADMCECLTEPTTTEDGAEATLEQADVQCVEGLCKSYNPQAPFAPEPPPAPDCGSDCGEYEVCAMVAAGGPALSAMCVPWEPCRSAGLCDCIVDTGTCIPRGNAGDQYCECDYGTN